MNFSMVNGMVCGEAVTVAPGFQDMMLSVQHRARGAALVQIAQGRPNEYMGNPGIINDLNRTPLTILVGPDAEATAHVKYALDHGADPNLPQYWAQHADPSPRFPLELAVEYGNEAQVQLLLAAKADVSKCDTARMLQQGVRKGSVATLLRAGVSASEMLGLVKKRWLVSPAWDANALKILKELAEQGVDWNTHSLEYLEFRDWVLEQDVRDLYFVFDKDTDLNYTVFFAKWNSRV